MLLTDNDLSDAHVSTGSNVCSSVSVTAQVVATNVQVLMRCFISLLQMMAVFTKANEALLAAHGTVFLVGNTHDILYPNSGSARDWAKGQCT